MAHANAYLYLFFILFLTLSCTRGHQYHPSQLLQSPSQADLIVSQDRSGNYSTIMEAIRHAKSGTNHSKFIIYIKQGIYHEYHAFRIRLSNIMLIGDGMKKTIITGNWSVGGGNTTDRTATVAVSGNRFIGKGITFRNTAGASNFQAMAFSANSEFSIFYQCGFEGYQDTLYFGGGKQFVRDCEIFGTVDFIFGYSQVVIQNSRIYVRHPLNGVNVITAQGQKKPTHERAGFVIQNCTVSAAPDLEGSLSSVKTYLGRPWGAYAETVFMQCRLDNIIDPAGWTPWDANNVGLNTLYYGEYANSGAGASTSHRVNWSGYHHITNRDEVSKFTARNLIDADQWIPETGVPYTPGL